MATFAPISIEALESLRKTGMTDDAIAEQMAQSSPGFSSQLAKIRKKFAGDPAATTAYLNTRFYGVVDHAPDKPKGIVGRSLDRVYDNFQKDTQDIRTALEQNAQGQQGFLDTTLQVAGNLGSIVASPVAQPVQEAVGSLAKAAYENFPGVKPLLQEVGQSRLVQEGIAPAIRSASSAISQASENNPSLRTLGAVGEGISDLADVYGGVQAGKMAVKGGMQAVQAIPQIPRLAGQAIGTTARIGTQPIREGFGGFMQGVRGQVDDAAKAAAPMELSGVAKEAVSKGLDENVVRFAVEQAPETKKAMAAMVKAAKEGSTKLGGDTAHKEILGQYILNNTEHLLNEKKAIGDALGAMKKGMADDVLDMTDDLVALQEKLRDAGAVINEKGVITRLAADSDDNIPMLQEALNFLQPDDAGRVVRRFKDVDMWRSKMFKEMNSAKAKMQPSASGQSVFGFAENVVNNLRRSAIKRASKNNSRLLAYNDAYEELSTQTSKFLKSIGYKGKLDIDSITAKELRTGEIALRTLGNASAETRDVLRELTAMARKYGYTSKVDEMNLVRWADTIENLFPVTPTRSLQGGVSRGTKDALGNFTEDVIRSGARRGVIGAVSEKVMEGIDTFRGMTPENQYRLLLELLDDASGSSMTPSPAQARSVIDVGGKIDDAKAVQSLDEIPKALPRNGATVAGSADVVSSTKNLVSPRTRLQDIIKTYQVDDFTPRDYKVGEQIALQAKNLKSKLGDVAAMDYDSLGRKVRDLLQESPTDQKLIDLDKAIRNANNAIENLDDMRSGFSDSLNGLDSEANSIIRTVDNLAKKGAFKYDDIIDEQGTTIGSLIDEYESILAEKSRKASATRSANKARAAESSGVAQGENTSGEAARLAKKFPNLTPEEIAQLTPEEKATGILGGSDTATSSVTQAQKSVNGGSVRDMDKVIPMRQYLKDNGIPVNPDDTVTVYHVTTPENAAKIENEGFIKGTTTGTSGMAGAKLKGAAFAGPDKKIILERWGSPGRDTVIEARVPVEDIRHPAQNLEEFFFEGGLKRGADGIWRPVNQPSTFVDRMAQNKYGSPQAIESPKALPRDGATTGIPKELEPLMKDARNGFTYIRNTEKSAKTTNMAQDIEPAGKYMTMQEPGAPADLPAGWERGTIKFDNPLVIDWVSPRAGGWKTKLSEQFGGKKGKELSKAITNAGYDGIITVDGQTPQEIVSLKSFYKQSTK